MWTRRAVVSGALGATAALLSMGAVAAIGASPATSRVSVSALGAQSDAASYGDSVSAGGRYVVFESVASNIVPNDTNNKNDIFVRDSRTGTVRRVSVSSSGKQAEGDSYGATITPNGRFVTFSSDAMNLVPDTNSVPDVFIRDLWRGTTERVSVAFTGLAGTAESGGASISADGRYVAFGSMAPYLVPWYHKPYGGIYVRDRVAHKTVLASAGFIGVGVVALGAPMISANGRFVVFSDAVWNGTSVLGRVYVRDLVDQRTSRVDVNDLGVPANESSSCYFAWPAPDRVSISANGRFVTFSSAATNLTSQPAPVEPNVYVRDLVRHTTRLVNVNSPTGYISSDASGPVISGDGRYVAFQAANSGGILRHDIYVRDMWSNAVRNVSLAADGTSTGNVSGYPVLSGDGRWVLFTSTADNLVADDTNGVADVFIRGPLY